MAANTPQGVDNRQFPRTATDEFLYQQFGGKVLAQEVRATVGVAVQSILPNNPERVGFIIVNTSAGTITLGLKRDVTSGSGIVLGPNGGFFRMSVLEDGGPTGWEIFGIGSAAGLSYYTLENIRYSARKGA